VTALQPHHTALAQHLKNNKDIIKVKDNTQSARQTDRYIKNIERQIERQIGRQIGR
jgi:hypothetical protein